MKNTSVITILAIAAFTIAASIFYSVGLPPVVDELPELPWVEGVTTEKLKGTIDDINNDDIYYARPKDIWRQAACIEVTVPLPDPDIIPEDPISFPEDESAAEVKSYIEVDSHGTSTFNRCVCGYKVEWTCTKVSRYIIAEATLNGETYVRYIYDRTEWDDEKVLRRRLNALVVSCSIDEHCDFPCEASTPLYSEWAMQCKGFSPHRVLPKAESF